MHKNGAEDGYRTEEAGTAGCMSRPGVVNISHARLSMDAHHSSPLKSAHHVVRHKTKMRPHIIRPPRPTTPLPPFPGKKKWSPPFKDTHTLSLGPLCLLPRLRGLVASGAQCSVPQCGFAGTASLFNVLLHS